MNKQIAEFLDYLKNVRNYSKDTVVSYKYDLEKYFAFLYQEGVLMDQVDTRLASYFLAKEQMNGVSKRSCKRRRSSLNHFYKYMVKVGYCKDNPFMFLDKMKTDSKLPQVLFEEQVNMLFKRNQERTDFLMLRDEAILEVLFFSGVRAEELINIDLQDLNLRRNTILVNGKGSKQRIVVISQDCHKTVENYINKVRNVLLLKSKTPSPALFLNNHGNRLTTRGLEYILKQTEQKIGMDLDLHPHKLRHSFATNLLSHDVPLLEIQKLLGHANLNATQIYTHVSEESLKQTYMEAHPRAKKTDK